MNKRNVFLWCLSVAMFVSLMFLLTYFIYNISLRLAFICLSLLTVTTVLYLVTTKKITHPTLGYTAVQALFFYVKCKKININNSKDFHQKFADIREFAKAYDFSKNLSNSELTGLYKCGEKLYKEIKNV